MTKGMKATIYYVDGERTNRDERFDASMGKLLPPEKFRKAAEVGLPTCFTPNTVVAPDWRLQLCEVLFTQFQAVDGPVLAIGVDNAPIRSMSVGDVIVLDGEPGMFFCSGVGFKPIEGKMEGAA